VLQYKAHVGRDCIAEVTAASSSTSKGKVVNIPPISWTQSPLRKLFISRVLPPNNTGTPLPAQSFSRTVAEPSTQHRELQKQCRPTRRRRTATKACTVRQITTSNYQHTTAFRRLLNRIRTTPNQLHYSPRRHIATDMQTYMKMVTRSRPFPHHRQHLQVEIRRREIVYERLVIPAASGK
jgi:hypothetical protein